MEYEIKNLGHTEVLIVRIDVGEEMLVQPGSLVASRGMVSIKAEKMAKSIIDSVAAFVFGGESIVKNRIRAVDKAELIIAGSYSGSVVEIDIKNGERYYLADRSYLAHIGNLDIEYQLSGADVKDIIKKTIASNVGLLIGNISGEGKLFLEADGGAIEYKLNNDEYLLVDNYNFLATDIDWKNNVVLVNKNVDLKSTVLSGEGWLLQFKGPGRVWIKVSTGLKQLSVLKE